MARNFVNQEHVATANGGNIKEGTRKGRVGAILSTSFFGLAILLSISVVAFTVMFFLSEVDGGSMMNTLNAAQFWGGSDSHDNVLVNRYSTAKRGNIIVVRHHWDRNLHPTEYYKAQQAGNVDKTGPYSFFIKRLIAISGDTITFRETSSGTSSYEIELNGEPLVEDYMTENSHWGQMENYKATFHKDFKRLYDNGARIYELTVPEGRIFFMGDNRNSHLSGSEWYANSYDCREMGPQPKSVIEGVVADIIKSKETVPSYVFRKIGEFFSFNWLF